MRPAQVVVFGEIHQEPFAGLSPLAAATARESDLPAAGWRIADSSDLLATGWRISKTVETPHVLEVGPEKPRPYSRFSRSPRRARRASVSGPAGCLLKLRGNDPPNVPIERYHREIGRRHRPVTRFLDQGTYLRQHPLDCLALAVRCFTRFPWSSFQFRSRLSRVSWAHLSAVCNMLAASNTMPPFARAISFPNGSWMRCNSGCAPAQLNTT